MLEVPFNFDCDINFIAMDNPELAHLTIDTATMFSYQNGTNIPWTHKEYHTPKL